METINLENINVTPLDLYEQSDINGGFIVAALGVYSGICALAYGAGYLYGTLTK